MFGESYRLSWADEWVLARLARAALAAEHPDHVIRAEHIGWRTRYVAQRRRGTAAHPYVVVTEYPDELRDALSG